VERVFTKSLFAVTALLALHCQNAYGISPSKAQPALNSPRAVKTSGKLKLSQRNHNVSGYHFGVRAVAGFFPWRWVYVGATSGLPPVNTFLGSPLAHLESHQPPPKVSFRSGGVQIGVPFSSWIPYGEVGYGFSAQRRDSSFHYWGDGFNVTPSKSLLFKPKMTLGGGLRYSPNKNLALDFSYQRDVTVLKEPTKRENPRGHVFQLGVSYKWPVKTLGTEKKGDPSPRAPLSPGKSSPLSDQLAP